jgi:hypothetical protein
MGVDYVLTGTVTEYSTTTGKMTVRMELYSVAYGKVRLSDEATATSKTPITGRSGHAEMAVKVVKPIVLQMKDALTGANL